MRSLKKTIEDYQVKLENPDLTPMSRELAKDTVHHLLSHQRLLSVLNDEMLPGRKFCYRYGHPAIESCNVCESCLKPEDLACNEGEE